MDIRAVRLAAGMGQSELARLANVSQPNLSAYENGRRTPSAAVLERITRALQVRPSARLEQHREAVHTAVAAHHARAPRVCGSVARGEAAPGSDLDILVDVDDRASRRDEVGRRVDRPPRRGVSVDVIADATLRGEFRERVLRDSVPV